MNLDVIDRPHPDRLGKTQRGVCSNSDLSENGTPVAVGGHRRGAAAGSPTATFRDYMSPC